MIIMRSRGSKRSIAWLRVAVRLKILDRRVFRADELAQSHIGRIRLRGHLAVKAHGIVGVAELHRLQRLFFGRADLLGDFLDSRRAAQLRAEGLMHLAPR